MRVDVELGDMMDVLGMRGRRGRGDEWEKLGGAICVASEALRDGAWLGFRSLLIHTDESSCR